MRRAALWLVTCVLLLLLSSGCAQTRTITIRANPSDAMIRVDGADRGRSPVIETMTFTSATDVHRVSVSRPGYKEAIVDVRRNHSGDTLEVALRPMTRRVTVVINPLPAVLSINGQAVSSTPVSQFSRELEFKPDAKNNWSTYTIRAERAGFQPAELVITRDDNRGPDYLLRLEPLKKTISITTAPPGAQVYLNDELLGVSPVQDPARVYPMDPDTGQWITYRLKATLPGYDPIELPIAWDEGKTDYHIDLAAKTKTVRIVTDPSGATVSVEGVTFTPAADGASLAQMQFPPVNAQGDLRTYVATISKRTESSEWEAQQLTIGWENGRTDYTVKLKEITTRPVELISAVPVRGDDGWRIVPQRSMTLADKDLTEGPNAESPVQITRLPKGSIIDSLALSRDGGRLLFSVLNASAATPEDFRSQLMVLRTDGVGGAELLTDAKSLELMPSFSPDGMQIVFASNRAGRKLSIWAMSPTGEGGITQLTTGDTNDLWPTIDSEPRTRLFYQAMVDTRPDPRLYMTQLGSTIRTDLTQTGGAQPRIGPKNDAIVFAAPNPRTGKRDIFIVADKGGLPGNLTNSPDDDDCDPTWSSDGSHLAFASDRTTDAQGQRNYNIWVLEIKRPDQARQITVNPSQDDRPAFDPSGKSVYFRSNRGGEWAIWRIKTR